MCELKMLFIFLNLLPSYYRWSSSDVLINSNILCLKITIKLSFFWSNRRLPTGFIFQQDDASAHIARSAQNWLWANCPDSRFHFKRLMASKFKPSGLSHIGAMLKA